MANRKIKHIVAKLVGASTEETLDVYDVDAVHTDKIYNGLDQTNAGYVLDARQGKALNDTLSGKVTGSIANNLTTTASGYVLDARQGKTLNDNKLATTNVANNLTTTAAGYALDARQGKTLNDIVTPKTAASNWYIAGHILGVCTGTTSSTLGGSISIAYPTGFSVNNCFVVGWRIGKDGAVVCTSFSNRAQITMQPSGVDVYTNHSTTQSKVVEVYLLR